MTLRALSPRLQKFYETALKHHGRLAEILAELRIGPSTYEKLRSALRRQGRVRTVRGFNPLQRGLPIECRSFVRLHGYDPHAIAAFEAGCTADPAITCAVKVCGRFDY